MKRVAQLSIDNKLFWALFTPVFLVSLLSAFFLLSSRFNDLNKHLLERTEDITKLVATTSEYAIIFSDQNMMLSILQNALNNQDINSVQIFNHEKVIIAELGNPSDNDQPSLTEQSYIIEHDTHLDSVRPIYYTNNRLDEAFNTQTRLLDTPVQKDLIGWVKIDASTSVRQVEKYQYASLVLFILTIYNIIIIWGALRISQNLALPINKVSSSLNKLVMGQFSSVKLTRLPTEYSSIQADLLDLTERLEKHHEELTAGIEESTEDMRRSMDSMEEKGAQLLIANREAMESNRLKSQFLANISHEVRTPLNAILGYTKTLKKGITDPQNQLYIETIQQSTNNLLAIIGDILDFSKIEAGKLSLENGHFNLKKLVDEVYQTLSINLLSNNKDIDLIPDFQTDMPEWFIGDSTRVRQILNNLIGNAIKFTHQGSIRTKVSVIANGDKKINLSFQIIDTGIGIPEDKIDRLFKPFSQVDTSTTRQFGGTGLGLVITKKLVEQMNGTIDVSSTSGVGSTFRFTLTLKVSNKQQNQYAPLEKHVVLLEPSAAYRSYIDNYLQSIGVTCTPCSDLEQIISTIHKQHEKIDSILLSVMPDKQSIQEARELISYAYEQYQLPFIIMIQPSGQASHYDALKNLSSDILLKPISQDRLYNALENIHSTSPELVSSPAEISTEATQSSPNRLQGLKILAVDDSPINLQLLGHWLTPKNIEFSLAYSGKQAIEMATQEAYDLIFMDIQMPEMDGMETTKHIRALPSHKDTPIIALTAHALNSEQQQILSSGMNDYLTKPIDEDILLNTIETWHKNPSSLQDQIDQKMVDIFDLEKALAIVDGKEEIAKEMFDMLANSLDSEKKLIQHHLENHDTEKLIEVVHRIHGASKYTGTVSIARHAGFLETHLKELGLEDVEGVAEDFIESIEDLLSHRELIPWTLK
ncbi:response regulator [Marinomonas sp. C2222]|uniref:histidine kinase n=1 Tax=Marinomonas sargassi TaxID=2984494 RepID=A0ABT2YVC2_9GAMM|nr:response regulator [Marinomonas sargassi]MCV2403836.1 response regulator [Marinomonas sargassi]